MGTYSLKVLIVTPHVFAGGAEKAALSLAYNLNSMGCITSIATLSTDLTKLPPHLTKLDYVLPEKSLEPPVMDGARTALTSTLKVFYSLVRLIRTCSDGFDILNACNFPSYWATYFARTGKPVVWTCSEVLGPYNQTKDVYDKSHFFRIALGLARAIDKRIVDRGVEPIVTCSELNSRLIKERYGRASMVMHTGVDYDFFNADVPNAWAHLELGDGPLLLHVGTLIQRKNHILSIRALKILKQHWGCAKLVIVGEGPWESILREEVTKLRLEEDVIFMGSISEDELRSLYHACDVNLFPVKDQTWGLVPFEALAAGKPSIVAEGCGAAEIMGREKMGFLINPNVEDLTEAVTFTLKHPELVEDMVKRGQRFVRENLTWEIYAREMYVVFRDLLGSVQKRASLEFS